MDCKVAFDIVSAGYRDWWVPVVGVFFIVIGTQLPRIDRHLRPGGDQSYLKAFAVFWILFSAFWTIEALRGTLGPFLSLRHALLDHRTDYVEGVVANFVPMPYEGHKEERFEVNGVRFHYSNYGSAAGFNNTKSHGGPIDEGVRVKIWHVGNDIARLEVCDPAEATETAR